VHQDEELSKETWPPINKEQQQQQYQLSQYQYLHYPQLSYDKAF
jgi:hypothetical protein